jgi:hypothetical protein
LEDSTLKFCFGSWEAAQFHFWEYLNGNQTFILDSRRPFIFSVHGTWTGLMFKIAWALDRPDGSHAMQALEGLIGYYA